MSTTLALRPESQIQAWDGPSFVLEYRKMEVAVRSCDTASQALELQKIARFWEEIARAAQEVEPEQACRRVRLRAKRRMGEILIEMERTGIRRGRGGDQKSKRRDFSLKKTLADLDISKPESKQAQSLARIPTDVFEDCLAANMGEDSMTSAEMDSPSEHWLKAGRSYEQKDAKPYRKLIVNIMREEDMPELAKRIGQPITERTRSINFWGTGQ